MNILYHFRTRGAGAESVHIAGIAGAFRKLGHTVTFCNPTDVNPLESKGANPFGAKARKGLIRSVVDLCPSFLFEFLELAYNLSARFRILKRIKRDAIDLIYERHAFFLFVTAQLTRKRNLPLIIEVNELVGDDRVRSQPLLSSIARKCDMIAFSHASLIVTVSPHLKRRIVEMGIPERRVLTLPNAINAEDYETEISGESVRAEHDIPTNAVVIGFLGWFVEWHRLDQLLEVFAAIADNHPEVRLMLVGDGELGDSLQELAASLGVEAKVTFTGAIGHDRVPECIAAMDVCVVPHSNEYRSPIKLFEYMGRGKAVVAPATEPIKMVIQDGANGLLFRPDSKGELQRALETAIVEDSLRSRIGNQARTDALSKHIWKRNAEKTLAACRSAQQALP